MTKTTAELWSKDGKTRLCGLGMIKSIQDSMHASNLTVPIVTFTAENAFTMDIKGTESITIQFERANDTNDGNFNADGSKMNNRQWIEKMRGLIDQWQAKHDGYILKYSEPGPESGHPDERTHNLATITQSGYLKSFSTNFVCGKPEYITGSLVFQPGSIRAKNGSVTNANDVSPEGFGQIVNTSDVYIYMTSSDQTAMYPIHTTICDENKNPIETISCVVSYEYTCGPLDPFPYMKITLSKKRMMTIAPDLVNDVVAGKNILYFNACGNRAMIVTKCSLNDSRYVLTAYAPEEVYKGTPVGDGYNQSMKPAYMIRKILNQQIKVGQYKFNYDNNKIIFDLNGTNPDNVDWGGDVTFPSTCSMWYVISVCAAKMGCTVWFMDGYTYVVNIPSCPPNRETSSGSGLYHIYHYEDLNYANTLYLNAVPGIPEKDTRAHYFCESVQDTPKLGDEGNDAFANSVTVSYTHVEKKKEGGEEKITETTKQVSTNLNSNPYLSKSNNAHGIRANGSLSLPEIRNETDAQDIANKYPILTADPQQSITFTLSEVTPDGTKWRSYFAPLSYLTKVVDFNTDTIIEAASSYFVQKGDIKAKEPIPYKLFLASMTRKFPKFSTEYTFGRLKNTDLSQTTSIIQRAIGNK